MPTSLMKALPVVTLVLMFDVSGATQRVPVLRDVKQIQVDQTVVLKPDKVKEDFAPVLVQDALRNALRASNFEVVDQAAVHAHIALEEFSSGSTAKRLAVGFGAGRSTVAGRLLFLTSEGKELASVPLRVRGSLLFSAYQGGNTQRRQATAAFDQRLIEEIARLK